MNRIQCAHGLDREGSLRSVQDVVADRHPMPMRPCSREEAAAIRQLCFDSRHARGRPYKSALAFYERHGRSNDGLRLGRITLDGLSRRFPQQPGENRAGFRIECHRSPRSASSNCRAVVCRSSRCRRGYRVGSFGAPRINRFRLTSLARAGSIAVPGDTSPGGLISATTCPRSVTVTVCPDRTSRMYRLKRFFSSRRPTVLI